MSDEDVSFRFDWHTQANDSFLKWLLPTVLPPGQIEALSAATDRFTDVRLTMQVNGIEVDAASFLEGVERNMEHIARTEARRLVDEAGGLARLREVVEAAEHAVMDELERRLASSRIVLDRSEDWS